MTIISRYVDSFFEDKSSLYTSNRWIAHKISIPTIITLNLISVHFPSKINWSETSLAMECVNLSGDIVTIEKNTNCTNTILIGDFNMNPFESGLVASNGINALANLKYASDNETIGRIINGTRYDFFYNPMWNFFGDFIEPYGTHYFRPPGHVSHEWHIYDQVIFRPSLKQYLNWSSEDNLDMIFGKGIIKKSDRPNFVEIVDRISGENLTKIYGRPDGVKYSDHLPIILKLKL